MGVYESANPLGLSAGSSYFYWRVEFSLYLIREHLHFDRLSLE